MGTGLTDEQAQRRDAFGDRLLSSIVASMDVYATYLGMKLDLYKALAQGAASSGELASRTGCAERYLREWLEQQAASGVLTVDRAGAPGTERRYALPPEYEDVLVRRESLNYLAPIVQLFIGAARPLDALLEAYRTGGGVPFADYGADVREGQAEINRPMFLQLLPEEWLPAIPEVHERLMADPPARIADVGCGAAWSCIGMALGYPKVQVDGIDLDAASVELGQRNVAENGVADRVRVLLRDAGDPALAGQYDLVTVFEALHDMSRPVDALRTMRGMCTSGGSVLVVDERVGEEFAAPADDIERLMYGWSILHCLPAGMAEQPSAATGTVMRPSTVRAYAQDAGFSKVTEEPIEHPFFRFYRLIP